MRVNIETYCLPRKYLLLFSRVKEMLGCLYSTRGEEEEGPIIKKYANNKSTFTRLSSINYWFNGSDSSLLLYVVEILYSWSFTPKHALIQIRVSLFFSINEGFPSLWTSTTLTELQVVRNISNPTYPILSERFSLCSGSFFSFDLWRSLDGTSPSRSLVKLRTW